MRRTNYAAVGFTILFLACGGSSDSGGGSVSPEQACDDVAEALCSGIERCAPFLASLLYLDHATCTARSKINCPASFGLPGTSMTPGQAKDCAKAANAGTCAELFEGVEACYTRPGMLANGAACGTHAQCQSAFCNVNDADGCGVCADKAALGATCKVDEQCADGQKCVNVGTFVAPNRVCATYQGQGETCTMLQPCTPDLACKSGTCQTPDAAGEACTNDPDTCAGTVTGNGCVANLCRPLSVAKPGESCGLDVVSQTVTFCAGASNCKPGTALVKGTCLAPADDGEMCAPLGPHCTAPAYCDNGLCKLRDPAACK